MSKQVYRFRVGIHFLQSCPGSVYDGTRISHACFLINTDLFEYDGNGYKRRRNVGCDPQFDWDRIGSALNGTTYISPDQLETAIKNSGQWSGPGRCIFT